MTGSPDIYWYARADKGIKSVKDATDKTFAYSAAGSSSHLIALSLLEQNKIKAKPTATGGIPSTYTQVMSGQIDIGWSSPPFGLEDLKAGKINIEEARKRLANYPRPLDLPAATWLAVTTSSPPCLPVTTKCAFSRKKFLDQCCL